MNRFLNIPSVSSSKNPQSNTNPISSNVHVFTHTDTSASGIPNSELMFAEFQANIMEYMITNELSQICDLLLRKQSNNAEFSFYISFPNLIYAKPKVAQFIIKYPKLSLPALDKCIESTQCEVSTYCNNMQACNSVQNYSVKQRCHVRLLNLPPMLHKANIGDIRGTDANRLMQLSGTVVRVSSVRMLEYSREYHCMNKKCNHVLTVYADPEQNYILIPPTNCPALLPVHANTSKENTVKSMNNSGGTTKRCNCTQFQENESKRCFVDYQVIKLQDSMERPSTGPGGSGLPGGTGVECDAEAGLNSSSNALTNLVPRSISLSLLGSDVVDSVSAGDDVCCVGLMICKWKPVSIGTKCYLDTHILVNSIYNVNKVHGHIFGNASGGGGTYSSNGMIQNPRFMSETHFAALLGRDGRPMGYSSSGIKFLLKEKFEQYWSYYRNLAVLAHKRNRSHCNSNLSNSNDKATDLFMFSGRDRILKSMCPQLHGLYVVKLALLLVLLSGCVGAESFDANNDAVATSTADASAMKSDKEVKGHEGIIALESGRGNSVGRRTHSHILFVGDPGTGKSQLLKFASKLIPRSVLTTGIGASGAGLTCTAYRDSTNGGEWSLEAGALVLSNDGICCIDEFNCMKEADRVSIHEAMEQQEISVAKAGLVVKLNTRCSVIAACNPKGGLYDTAVDINTNIGLNSPLLSRFDVVLLLLDQPEKAWDTYVSTFLLKQALHFPNPVKATGNANPVHTQTQSKPVSPHVPSATHRTSNKTDLQVPALAEKAHWDVGTLQQYIAYVRSGAGAGINGESPRHSKAAENVIIRYYQQQRQQSSNNHNPGSTRVTVRLLESLLRLSESHAKLMCKRIVTLEDAVVAIWVVSLSQQQLSLSNGNSSNLSQHQISVLHSNFPLDPDVFYKQSIEIPILASLNCTRESLLTGNKDTFPSFTSQTSPPPTHTGDFTPTSGSAFPGSSTQHPSHTEDFTPTSGSAFPGCSTQQQIRSSTVYAKQNHSAHHGVSGLGSVSNDLEGSSVKRASPNSCTHSLVSTNCISSNGRVQSHGSPSLELSRRPNAESGPNQLSLPPQLSMIHKRPRVDFVSNGEQSNRDIEYERPRNGVDMRREEQNHDMNSSFGVKEKSNPIFVNDNARLIINPLQNDQGTDGMVRFETLGMTQVHHQEQNQPQLSFPSPPSANYNLVYSDMEAPSACRHIEPSKVYHLHSQLDSNYLDSLLEDG